MLQPKTYRSAISAAIYIPLCLALFALLITAIFTRQAIPSIILTTAVFGLVLPILLRTNYTIDGNILKIRSGFIISKNIPIDNISQIKKTDSILSSPALSVKERIELFYNKYDSIIISPVNRPEFIKDLQAVNPAITTPEV